MVKNKTFAENDVETEEYIDLDDFTPLEREIIFDFDLLDEDEKKHILLFAAQLIASH